MGLIEAIMRTCEHVLDNLTELKVNLIHSRYKQDLRIDNGAGASILLTGNQVVINGLDGSTFDIIYLGADHKCWIARDLITGDLVFHVNQGNGLLFEYVHVAPVPATGATYIQQASPEENQNASAYMTVGSSPSREILVMFDLSVTKWPAASAILRLYVTSTTTTSDLTISKLQTVFDPTTVTWNTQPAYITGEASAFTISPGSVVGWVEIDVSAMYNDPDNRIDGKFGLNIKLAGGQSVTFNSTVGTNPPQLAVTE